MNSTKLIFGALGTLVIASEIGRRRRGGFPSRRSRDVRVPISTRDRRPQGSRITIPEAQEQGFAAGNSAASYADFDTDAWLDDHLDPSDPMDCYDELVEALEQEAGESELNARSYSPWEHLAYAINTDENAEELWEAYYEGVSKGIEQGVEQRLGTVQQRRSLRGARRLLPQVLNSYMQELRADQAEEAMDLLEDEAQR